MAEDRISTPSSSAGLIRFSDGSNSKVRITPEIVVGAAIVLIVVEIAATLLTKASA